MTGRAMLLALLAGVLSSPLAGQTTRALFVGRPVTDSLTSRDPVRRVSRAPYHTWQLQGRRGERLALDLVSTDFDGFLVLADPDGNTLGSDDDSGGELNARLRVVLSRDGTYRVIATALGDSARGVYTLSAGTWEAPRVPQAGAVASIAPGAEEEGLLEPGDEQSPEGPYQDRWVFDARPGARLRVELRSEDLDSYLVVLGPDGRQVGSDDDGLGGRNSAVSFRTAAGRYTILASSFGDVPRTGVYRLTLLDDAGAYADPGAAASIGVGETREGRLESGDAVGTRGVEDRWTFEGRAGQVVRLDAISEGFDVYLVLRLDEMAVDSNDDGGDGTNARIVTALPRTGKYTAVVAAYTAGRTGGRYTLGLAASSSVTAAGRSARIAFGERMAGRLERGDAARAGGGLQDVWEFDARPGQEAMIELRSGAFDAYLELQDPSGVTVAENDDGLGEGTDSFIAAHLQRGGRYRIIVRCFGEGYSEGLYELALGLAGAAAESGRVVEVRLGETHAGRLEEGDTVMGDGTYADVFVFRPTAAGQIRVDLRSHDFDAYLILQDEEGRTLATDDDGGSGTDSQLTYDVMAGRTYRILANSYAEDRRTGSYQFAVRPAG